MFSKNEAKGSDGVAGRRRSMSFWVTRSSLVLVLMGGPVIPVLVGCSGPATPDSGEARAGTLRVGLGAALDGVQYWLEASFAVTGPESTVLASAPGDTVLRAELSPGRYVAELQPGYQVLQESNGTLVPVHSELRSEAAQS
ncbi:MAG TPA: hypothetical protein VFP10_14910, partial [Candidatus Eisenbacteria bacterium]|nr:hypothetical protein [Candidatus Eisenbacteria bacterium]